ncbi:hypothetical protein ACFL1X_02890, partial [Candidatus Hydrogenedentota bacterium]
KPKKLSTTDPDATMTTSRRLENVAIQVYLTAAVMNLKRLATAFHALLRLFREMCQAKQRSIATFKKIWEKIAVKRLWILGFGETVY